MTKEETDALIKLVEQWSQPVNPTADDPTFDNGRAAARAGCVEDLQEFIDEHGE